MTQPFPTFTRLAEPLRGQPPVLCQHCCGEIEAYGINDTSIVINGTYSYQWRHVATGDPYCDLMPPKSRPYDDFDAQKALNRAKAVSS